MNHGIIDHRKDKLVCHINRSGTLVSADHIFGEHQFAATKVRLMER